MPYGSPVRRNLRLNSATRNTLRRNISSRYQLRLRRRINRNPTFRCGTCGI